MKNSHVKIISFTKPKKKNSGYVLLFLMLIIASVALYLSYNLSLKKTNAQSALVAKTATEFSYWFDVQKNYQTDFNITTPTALNGINMNTLISTQHYLPYGMARAPGIPNVPPSHAVTAVSEFQCSSLPGMTQADNISDSGITDYTCPTQNGVAQTPQCTLNEKAYLSCAPSATAPSTGSSAPAFAQYYFNSNHIALGTNNNTYNNNTPIGLGLIVRTPGTASSSVTLTGGGSRGVLQNGSLAQSLISLLPSSSYNVYTTADSNVKGIGIGSYLSNPGSGVLQDNNRYTKIVDMGLVQSVDLTTVQSLIAGGSPPCYGWDNTGQKIGTNGSYTRNQTTAPTGGVTNSFPPTCIRIDMSKYGPGGSANCHSLDLLFSIYRNNLQTGTVTNNTDTTSSRFFSATDAMITPSAAGSNFRDVYLAQSIQSFTNLSSYTYSTNGPVPTSTTQPEQYNWLIYILRCTRANS